MKNPLIERAAQAVNGRRALAWACRTSTTTIHRMLYGQQETAEMALYISAATAGTDDPIRADELRPDLPWGSAMFTGAAIDGLMGDG